MAGAPQGAASTLQPDRDVGVSAVASAAAERRSGPDRPGLCYQRRGLTRAELQMVTCIHVPLENPYCQNDNKNILISQ